MLYKKNENMKNISECLEGVINFKLELPEFIFAAREYRFWYFERPVLSDDGIIEKIFTSNKLYFSAAGLVCFGMPSGPFFSTFLFENEDVGIDLNELKKGSYDFFGGEVGYPIILTNQNLDWIAFESVYEELGVFAVKLGKCQPQFLDDLNEYLITSDQLTELATSDGYYSQLASLLLINYEQKEVRG